MRDCFWMKAGPPRMSADGEEAEVLLYGDIVQDLPKTFKEQFPEDKSAADFDKAIKEAKGKGAKRLTLRINSPGGVVYQAIAMRAILAAAKFDSIHIRIEGLCASAATLVATMPGAKVSIAPGSEYMIHNPWTFAMGSAEDLEKVAENLRATEATSRSMYMQRTGQEEDQIKAWMDEETWFSAEDAVKYGFCDEVTEEQASEPAAACVSAEHYALMREMYAHIPDGVKAKETVSNAAQAVAAGEATENKTEQGGTDMDIKDLTQEELMAQRPDLCAALSQRAIEAERQRMQDIDDLTMDGDEYRQMAEEAKKMGTSAADYHKQIVQHQRQKKASFLASRQQETEPASGISGGAAEENQKSKAQDEESEMKAFEADMKEALRGVHASNETMI